MLRHAGESSDADKREAGVHDASSWYALLEQQRSAFSEHTECRDGKQEAHRLGEDPGRPVVNADVPAECFATVAMIKEQVAERSEQHWHDKHETDAGDHRRH